MKKSHLLKAALLAASLVTIPSTGFAATSAELPQAEICRQASPSEREAVKQLLLALQDVTGKVAQEYATIGDLRNSVSEMAQIDTFGCPESVRSTFAQLATMYAEHFTLLEKVFSEAGYDDSTLLSEVQTACNDPRVQEGTAKMQGALIAFVNSLVPYLIESAPAY